MRSNVVDVGDLTANFWKRHVFDYVPSVNTLYITKEKKSIFRWNCLYSMVILWNS